MYLGGLHSTPASQRYRTQYYMMYQTTVVLAVGCQYRYVVCAFCVHYRSLHDYVTALGLLATPPSIALWTYTATMQHVARSTLIDLCPYAYSGRLVHSEMMENLEKFPWQIAQYLLNRYPSFQCQTNIQYKNMQLQDVQAMDYSDAELKEKQLQINLVWQYEPTSLDYPQEIDIVVVNDHNLNTTTIQMVFPRELNTKKVCNMPHKSALQRDDNELSNYCST